MDIPTLPQIVESIDAFLERHAKMPPTRFGREATNNANIVADLRSGHMPSLAVLHRLKAFMDRKDAELGGVDHADSDSACTNASAPGKSGEITAQAVTA